MRRKDKPRLWRLSFPQKFSYEVDAPLDGVVRHLAELEQESGPFRTSQEVSVLPVQDHYVFRVRRRRHGTLTVSAEGQVWQDETGCVLVEGETQINGWNWIGSLVVMSLLGILTSLVSMPAVSRPILLVPFFITMAIGFAISFAAYRRDRQQLINALDEVVASIKTGQAYAKPKRSASLALKESEAEIEGHLTGQAKKHQRLSDE